MFYTQSSKNAFCPILLKMKYSDWPAASQTKHEFVVSKRIVFFCRRRRRVRHPAQIPLALETRNFDQSINKYAVDFSLSLCSSMTTFPFSTFAYHRIVCACICIKYLSNFHVFFSRENLVLICYAGWCVYA